MPNSKTFQLLQSLSSDEAKRLATFLASPWFNSNKKVAELWKLLSPHYPAFGSPKLTEEKLANRLYKGSSSTAKTQMLRNLATSFYALLEKYLLQLQMEKEETGQRKLMIKAYAARPGLSGGFRNKIEILEEGMAAQPNRDAQFYREAYWLKEQLSDHPLTGKKKLVGLYGEAMQHLDNWFLMEKLLLCCKTASLEQVFSEEHNIWLLEEIVEETTKRHSGNNIAGAYLNMYKLLATKDKKYFTTLKDTFFKNPGLFSKQHTRNILQSLINYVIRTGNEGDESSANENLELYQFGLKEGLFLENGLMDDLIYTNIAITALLAGEYDWCGNYLSNYKIYLDKKTGQDAYSLGRAFLLFYKNENQQAIDFLNNMQFTDDFYYVRGNSLLLRIYFEQQLNGEEYFDLLWSKADAFEKYLRQNKNLSGDKLKRFLNFTFFLKRLIKIGPDKTAIEKTRNDIATADELFQKPWLLKQIDVLKKRGA